MCYSLLTIKRQGQRIHFDDVYVWIESMSCIKSNIFMFLRMRKINENKAQNCIYCLSKLFNDFQDFTKATSYLLSIALPLFITFNIKTIIVNLNILKHFTKKK